VQDQDRFFQYVPDKDEQLARSALTYLLLSQGIPIGDASLLLLLVVIQCFSPSLPTRVAVSPSRSVKLVKVVILKHWAGRDRA
jgi:hypothetical protein